MTNDSRNNNDLVNWLQKWLSSLSFLYPFVIWLFNISLQETEWFSSPWIWEVLVAALAKERGKNNIVPLFSPSLKKPCLLNALPVLLRFVMRMSPNYHAGRCDTTCGRTKVPRRGATLTADIRGLSGRYPAVNLFSSPWIWLDCFLGSPRVFDLSQDLANTQLAPDSSCSCREGHSPTNILILSNWELC